MAGEHKVSEGNDSLNRLSAKDILQKSIDALNAKRINCESILEDVNHPLSKLLFIDSASVISDCIEIVTETAREHGITVK